MQFQVKADKKSIDQIYEEVAPKPAKVEDATESSRVLIITADMVYETYLKQKASEAIIMALREHTVDEVLTQVPEIAAHAMKTLNKMMDDSPVEVTALSFPNGIGVPPDEVIDAKRKLFAIDEEKERMLRSLEADLQIETQRQAVQRARVHNDLINAEYAGVGYEVYVKLKNEERFADAADALADAIRVSNGKVIVQAPAMPVTSEK